MCLTMNQKRGLIRHFRRVLMILLTLICLVGTLPVPEAHAAGAAQVTFTVKQQFINNSTSAPPRETFTYQLSPQTPDAPMPQGSGMQVHRFSIKGTSELDIGPISFSSPGLYVYTLSCATTNMLGYSQNRKMYTIEVHISNESNASVIYLGDKAKAEDLAFERTYNDQSDKFNPSDYVSENKPNIPIPVKGPKTGDFSNPTLWILLIAFCSVLLIVIIFIGRRLNRLNKQTRGRRE